MFNTFRIIPAYGREYSTIESALVDWQKGKDFYSREGYCSIRDIDYLREEGFSSVTLSVQNEQGVTCRAVINI